MRRLTSIGIDTMVWIHARSAARAIPQRSFLERFEPTRRWLDGGTPPLGLARAAVLYHLPSGSPEQTAAHLFLGSKMCSRICPSEIEWLDAQLHARFSYFQVTGRQREGVVLRDWFAVLSGRRDVVVKASELGEAPAAKGHTVFARVIPYRGEHFVDELQALSSAGAGIADPAAPPRAVWAVGRNLRDRTTMLETLFETWTHATNERRTP